jgi:hypothetical protein
MTVTIPDWAVIAVLAIAGLYWAGKLLLAWDDRK